SEVDSADDCASFAARPDADRADTVDPPQTLDPLADAEFQRALDALLGWDGSPDDPVLAQARAGLTRAADDPRHRMTAARQLAQLDADAGDWMSAMRWLEHAAGGALAASDEEELAYEMANVLE